MGKAKKIAPVAHKRPAGRPRTNMTWDSKSGKYVPMLQTRVNWNKRASAKKPRQTGVKIGRKFPRGRPKVGMIWVEAKGAWFPDPTYKGKRPASQVRAAAPGRYVWALLITVHG